MFNLMVNLCFLIIIGLIASFIVYFIAAIFKSNFTAKNKALKWGIIISLFYVLIMNKLWNDILEQIDVNSWIIMLITLAFLILPSLIAHLYDKKYNYNKQFENINEDNVKKEENNNVKGIISNIKNSNKFSKRNKIIFAIIGIFVIVSFGIAINRVYQKNQILKCDSNFEASYVTYTRGLGCMIKEGNSYKSQLDAKNLIIKGIDIAKDNEKNVPASLKENYEDYLNALKNYSIDLHDNGEVISCSEIISNKMKKLEDKYNISKNQIEKNVGNKLKEYDIQYHIVNQ